MIIMLTSIACRNKCLANDISFNIKWLHDMSIYVDIRHRDCAVERWEKREKTQRDQAIVDYSIAYGGITQYIISADLKGG